MREREREERERGGRVGEEGRVHDDDDDDVDDGMAYEWKMQFSATLPHVFRVLGDETEGTETERR